MKPSVSGQPDLDWSQIRETIKLLTVSVAQVESGVKSGDESVNVLTNSFSSMVADMQAIHEILVGFPASEPRDNALAHCLSTQERISSSIVAFQFYDRLQQCLSHVTVNLLGLSDIIDTPQRLYNPEEWHKFQLEIRNRYTMESEKQMFDAILQGKSIDEAIHLVNNTPASSDDDIELF